MKPNFKALAISTSIVVSLIFALALATEVPGPPATDLKLAPDLSFSDDSSPNFPIKGNNLSDGSIAGEILRDSLRTVALARAKGMDRHPSSDLGDLPGHPGKIARQVRLVENDDWSGAAAAHQREIALEARQIEVTVGRRYDEDDVDVRR